MAEIKWYSLAAVVALFVPLLIFATYSASFQVHPQYRDTRLEQAPCHPVLEPRNQSMVTKTPTKQCHERVTQAETNSTYTTQYHGGAAQGERQFTIRRACSKDRLAKVSLTCPFQVIDNYTLLAGIMAKCGGTTWDRLLLNLLGFHNATEDIDARPTNQELHKKVHKIGTLKKDKQTYLMQNYKRIVFVRNPFVRLLSGFRDRLEVFPNRFLGHRKAHNKKIYTQYEHHTKAEMPDASVPSELYNVTFKGFVSYYLAGRGNDVHWLEQYKQCHPCIGYDYIGKVETYDQDIMEILKLIDADPAMYRNKVLNPTNSRKDDTLSRYYQTLSDAQFKALTKKLQPDLTYFGYSIPESIRRPHLS